MQRMLFHGRLERNWVRIWITGWLICKAGYALVRELGLKSVGAFLVGYLFVAPCIEVWHADEIMNRLVPEVIEHFNIRADKRVERLGNRLLSAAGLAGGSVVFGLGDVTDSYYNAYFVWPNHIGVTESVLEDASEAEVLGVLAHEIGHLQLANEPMIRRARFFVRALSLRLGFMGQWVESVPQTETLLKKCERYVWGLMSRMLENQADQRGFDLLVRSRQPIAGPALFFHREMGSESERTLDEELMDTHPSRKTRFIKAVNRMEAVANYQVRVKGAKIYVRDKLFVQVDTGSDYESERLALITAGNLIMAIGGNTVELRPEFKEPLIMRSPCSNDQTAMQERINIKKIDICLSRMEFSAGF